MKVVFFGTPKFAVPSLKRIAASRHHVELVVTRPDKPVGRKQVLTPPPVADIARGLGIPIAQPKKLKSGPFPERFHELAADAAVVVAYGRLIPPGLLEGPRHGWINLHPSLLPRHRGPSPIQWSLVTGDRVTGVTTMMLDEGTDTGPILLQERVDVLPRETAEELAPRLARLGADLLVKTLDGLQDGSLKPVPQPEDGASLTPMLNRSFGKVDWSLTAGQLVNRLRGLTPWPGLYTSLRGGRVKLHGLEKTESPPGDEAPGSVIEASPDGLVVRCGKGTSLRITELQREGRRRMPVDAFLVGERVVVGERFI